MSWRDLQHLIVLTSDKINPSSPSWLRNGAGLLVSEYYGFGSLNAGHLVEAARRHDWTTSRSQHVCNSVRKFGLNRRIASFVPVVVKHNTTSCADQPNCVSKLEHVKLYVTLDSYPRGGVEIELVSPSGTRSPLLRRRPKDRGASVFSDWAFMSLFFWNEDPRGEWTIRINQTVKSMPGTLTSLHMEWYGTCENNTIPTTPVPITTSTKSPITIVTETTPGLSLFAILVLVIFSVGVVVALGYTVFTGCIKDRQQRHQITNERHQQTNGGNQFQLQQLQPQYQEQAVSHPTVLNPAGNTNHNHNHNHNNNNNIHKFSETSFGPPEQRQQRRQPEVEPRFQRPPLVTGITHSAMDITL